MPSPAPDSSCWFPAGGGEGSVGKLRGHRFDPAAPRYFVHRAFGKWGATIPLALFGIGALGVGVFPGNVPVMHPIFAMIAFFSGGVAAVLAYKVTAMHCTN